MLNKLYNRDTGYMQLLKSIDNTSPGFINTYIKLKKDPFLIKVRDVDEYLKLNFKVLHRNPEYYKAYYYICKGYPSHYLL